MKIGVLGSGDVGQALAHGFVSRGDQVTLGTRDPGKLNEWRSAHPSAQIGSFAEAAQLGEAVVIATPAEAAFEVIGSVGVAAFEGKVVIDVTNALRFDAKGPHLTVGFDDSQGERVQRALPRARVVKAFNTVGFGLMYRPQLPGGPPSMFICGNDEAAKATVGAIVRDFGWEVVDMGDMESARIVEPLCPVWILHSVRSGRRNFAFKLIGDA